MMRQIKVAFVDERLKQAFDNLEKSSEKS